MLVRREVTDVRRVQTPDTVLQGLARQAGAERPRKHVRIKRQDGGAEGHWSLRRAVSVAPTNPPIQASSVKPPPIVASAAMARSSICLLSPWFAVATNKMPSKVATAVIAGRIDAAVSLRRRRDHSGRMVTSSDTSAEPMKTDSAKPMRTKVQFIGAG